jgi:glutathione S-transferase/GST-like protein
MPEPIEVFFWATPNCWKVTIALEEMGLPYVIRPVAIGQGEQFSPELLAVSPNNKVPAIIDPAGPDGAPVSAFESGAILQYLARKTARFYPAGEAARLEVDKWLFWQMAGVGPMFGQASHFRIYAPSLVDDALKIAYPMRRYDAEVNRLLGVLDRRLEGASFVAGDYSIADMAIYPWLSIAGFLGQDLSGFARVQSWLERVSARPAVQRGMAVGAELRSPPPERGTDEHRAFAAALFGQTAASIAQAAASRAAAPAAQGR